MVTRANQVYNTDVIAQTLVRHLHKTTLRSIMMIEKEGDMFDWCVKALYREVEYGVVHDMTRSNERKIKYLNAVHTIDANTSLEGKDEQVYADMLERDHRVASLTQVNFLRLKCPNLRLITRHDPSAQHPRFTIILTKGKTNGVMRLHHGMGMPTIVNPVRPLPVAIFDEPWLGWDFRQSSTLWVMPGQDPQGDHRKGLLEKLGEAEQLGVPYSEINTADLRVKLSHLTDIVNARGPNDRPISRITALVDAYTFDEFFGFIEVAGLHLIALDLSPFAHYCHMGLDDLPKLALLIRQKCPKLTSLRLALSEDRYDPSLPRGRLLPNNRREYVSPFVTITCDNEIEPPSSTMSFGGGALRHFGIYFCHWLGRKGIDSNWRVRKLMSFNFVRSLACLMAPGGHLALMDANKSLLDRSTISHELDSPWIYVIKDAVKFFHRLGPILEPHFRGSDCFKSFGVRRLTDLRDLRYHVDGTPMTLQESRLAEVRLPRPCKRLRIDHEACRHAQSGDVLCEADMHHQSWEAGAQARRDLHEAAKSRYVQTLVLPVDYQLYLENLEAQRRAQEEADHEEWLWQQEAEDEYYGRTTSSHAVVTSPHEEQVVSLAPEVAEPDAGVADGFDAQSPVSLLSV